MSAQLTRGWLTDLAVNRFAGAEVSERDDHLVVRSPRNPTFHWGNYVLVTDPDSVDDAGRWLEVFAAEFPDSGHVSIGLPVMPTAGLQAWAASGVAVETDEVLYTTTQPRVGPLADGYVSRVFATEDWESLVALDLAENERTGEHSMEGHEEFLRRQVTARQGLVDRGLAQWFGAFEESSGSLVAALGIVMCDDVARYQSVGTDAEHRRRGLAAHLLGEAAAWAADRGATAWVIVTETTNPAGRVYRSVGFEPDAVQVSAYRAPRHPVD